MPKLCAQVLMTVKLPVQVSEIGHLSALPNLENLRLKGNPLTQSPSYRSHVFSYLPETAQQVHVQKLVSS